MGDRYERVVRWLRERPWWMRAIWTLFGCLSLVFGISVTDVVKAITGIQFTLPQWLPDFVSSGYASLVFVAIGLIVIVMILLSRPIKTDNGGEAQEPESDPEDDGDVRLRERRRRINDLEMERLVQLYGGGPQLLRRIRYEAQETIEDSETLKTLPYTRQASVSERIARRRRALHQEVNAWKDLTKQLVEKIYGLEAREVYESDDYLPPHDPPGFDTATAEEEARLYTNVWRRTWRLHALLESDTSSSPPAAAPSDVTLSGYLDWNVAEQEGRLMIRLTNNGPRAEFVATVEDVRGVGPLEVPWPVKWRNAEGRNRSIPRGASEMLHLLDLKLAPNFLVGREIHFQRPLSEPVKAIIKLNPMPRGGAESAKTNIRFRVTAHGAHKDWPIQVWFRFGYLRDRKDVGVWEPDFRIVGGG